ncbi:PadR family transcriptional regulator [Falsibacillus pallidus]|uniref:PadR family transcriptional regulator n=1 Tax=Falsibacillus pallidus TaxID=493781 RepID=A0A370GIV7_9BACI|nr:PadR family transcriptional regulator [Falsibacillus pallidus]RDI43156.1 PadR family transcriptional regulator [Falsibacillus pallidus]
MSMKLIVLGLLMEGEKHPYEIQQLVKSRQMKFYIKMAPGSLYYAFDKLKEEGFIEVAEVVKDTNRPDKTIYRITSKGKAEFEFILMKQLGQKEQISKPIYAALSFANYANPEQVKERLIKKIRDTEDFLNKIKILYSVKKESEDRAKLYIILGVWMQLKTELVWLREIYKDLEEGKLHEIGMGELDEDLW